MTSLFMMSNLSKKVNFNLMLTSILLDFSIIDMQDEDGFFYVTYSSLNQGFDLAFLK